MKILLIEDEKSLQELVKINLEMEGYSVIVSKSGTNGLEMALNEFFDLIILDIMLPGIDGLEVCEKLKLHRPEVPVLFLSAKGSAKDRIAGLKLGDDYLTKPFELEELLLRVEKLLQRNNNTNSNLSLEKLIIGKNTLNCSTYQLTKENNTTIDLNQKEVLILRLLFQKNGDVVSRDEILDKVWQNDGKSSGRMVDNYITNLRKHIEEDSKNPKFIKSVRGVGYKLIVKT